MNERDRSTVLYAASYGPIIGIKLGIKYLKFKRAARRGERRFYHELRSQGLSRIEARYLAEQYGSAVSVRSLIRESGAAIPGLGWL